MCQFIFLLKGSVTFLFINVELPSVLKFDPVIQGQSLTKEFNIHNYGMGYLTIDSIVGSFVLPSTNYLSLKNIKAGTRTRFRFFIYQSLLVDRRDILIYVVLF